MNILFLNWRDIKHPKAGGAEVVTHEIAKRWVLWGHSVTVFTATFPGCAFTEEIDGYKVIRFGGQVTVRFHAMMYYLRHMRGKFDVVIDEINTIPFFTPLYVRKPKVVYFNQLCRQTWFYESRFPFSIIGYLIEPIYLQLYRGVRAMVISESTKRDLTHYGFKKEKITVFSMAIDFAPSKRMPKKEKVPTMIYVGRLTPSKRVIDALRGFVLVKRKIPSAKFWIIGRGDDGYTKKLKQIIRQEKLTKSVQFFGFVSQEKKRELMGRAHVIVVTSIKEGWGLIVTEANACGTVATVYDVDGLRDSVKNGKTGLVTKKNYPSDLARQVLRLLENKALYEKMQENAHQWSYELTWYRSAKESLAVLEGVVGGI